jgi:hypothetical protein
MARFPRQAFLLFLVLSTMLAVAQKPTRSVRKPSSTDQRAAALAAQSIAAMTGGATIADVTLTGNVTWTVGSDTETGAATLQALGPGESRMDLVLSKGTRTEIRDASTGTPLGKWVAQSGSSGQFVFHNCQTDAVWFFPVFSSLGSGQNVVLSYIGQETRNAESVQHIQSYVYAADTTSTLGPTPQQLSTTDFYLDATTLLPVAITFNTHPDNDAATNLLVEVDFANYQTMSGVMVPTHIQSYRQGALMVDLTITAASFNTGLQLSTFATK